MAEQELMTWNKNNSRWYKKHIQKQYCVTAGKLKKLFPDLVSGDSQSGTRKAANQWWTEKLAELRSTPAPANRDQSTIDRLNELANQHERDEDFEKSNRVRGKIQTIHEWQRHFPNDDLPSQILDSVAVDETAMLRDRLTAKAAAGMDCESNKTAWLDHKKKAVAVGKLSAGHWDNLRRELSEFVQWFGPARSVTEISGRDYLAWHDLLVERVTDGKLSEPAAKRLQGTAKSWIQWMYDVETLDALPRNFSDKKLNWEVPTNVVEGWSKSDVKFLMDHAGEPLSLYCLLMLNCGFTQIDIAELKKSEIDWKARTITRARSKTRERSKNVPTVTWPLWPATYDLLKKHLSSDQVLALTNEDGGPLKSEKIRGKDEAKAGKFAKVDNIATAYYRLKIKHPDHTWRQLKELRKTGPSLFRNNPQFQSIRELFLGHTDKTVADKAYAGAPMQLLAEAVNWLGKELGLIKPKAK